MPPIASPSSATAKASSIVPAVPAEYTVPAPSDHNLPVQPNRLQTCRPPIREFLSPPKTLSETRSQDPHALPSIPPSKRPVWFPPSLRASSRIHAAATHGPSHEPPFQQIRPHLPRQEETTRVQARIRQAVRPVRFSRRRQPQTGIHRPAPPHPTAHRRAQQTPTRPVYPRASSASDAPPPSPPPTPAPSPKAVSARTTRFPKRRCRTSQSKYRIIESRRMNGATQSERGHPQI